MREVWKLVPNTNGELYVSDLGRVWVEGFVGKNGLYQKPGFRSISVSGNGYCQFRYRDTCRFLHRDVARAFLTNVSDMPCVNHKDGDKLNNTPKNLEWCTYSRNSYHSYDIGIRLPSKQKEGEDSTSSKLTQEQAQSILDNKKLPKTQRKTHKELAKDFNVSPSTVGMVSCGKNWSHLE